jgi:hypothetical protein
MSASIGSALIVVLGFAAATACAATGVAAAQAVETTDRAPPGACRAAIARMETALNEALAQGRAVATAPQSVDAMLHHQPTRDSVARAQSESVKRVANLLATARELRSESKRSECISMLEKINLLVGVH